jgi:hypothetical protein
MTAADIASTLGDLRREGRGWRCRCPLHACWRSFGLRSVCSQNTRRLHAQSEETEDLVSDGPT